MRKSHYEKNRLIGLTTLYGKNFWHILNVLIFLSLRPALMLLLHLRRPWSGKNIATCWFFIFSRRLVSKPLGHGNRARVFYLKKSQSVWLTLHKIRGVAFSLAKKLAIQRGNAARLLSTLPVDCDEEKYFDAQTCS